MNKHQETPIGPNSPEGSSLAAPRLLAVTPEVLKREVKVLAEQDPNGTGQKEALAGDVLDDDGVGVGARRKVETASKTNKVVSPRS